MMFVSFLQTDVTCGAGYHFDSPPGFSFLYSVMLTIACLFVLFFVAIVLTALLRTTASDIPLWNFQTFLPNNKSRIDTIEL